MASLLSKLVVELQDKVSGPAKAAGRSMAEMSRTIKEAGQRASFSDRLNASIYRTNEAMGAARLKMLDAVAAGYALKNAFAAPIQNAMKLEQTLSGIGSKAGLSAGELAKMRRSLRGASGESNQFTADLADAADYLVGMGMSGNDAQTAVKDIGKAATASGADVKDMAAAGFAAITNLKVPADQVMTSLDAMAAAGKRGGFELKDMAAYFPTIGASYAALGQSGTGAVADLAAALQALRMDTGDASSAATNLQNTIQKMQSPATVRAFKKMGVNLNREMAKAGKRGLTPIEAIAEITNKTLKGDLSKLGYLFEDSQAQAGIRSLIQHGEEYKKIREEAMNAKGTNQADFERAMQTTEEQVKRTQIAVSNLAESIGTSLLPAIQKITDLITPMIDAFAKFTEQHPNIVGALVGITGGFLALKIAMAGLNFLGLFSLGGALRLLKFPAGLAAGTAELNKLKTSLAGMGGLNLNIFDKFGSFATTLSRMTGLTAIAEGLGTIAGALTAPGWVLAGIAIAGVAASFGLLVKYWDRISSFTGGFFGELASELSDLLAPAFKELEPYLQPIADMFGVLTAKASEFGSWIGSFFSREILTDAQKAQYSESGAGMARAMVDGVKNIVNGLVEWFASLPARIIAAVGSIDLSGLFKWPSLPSYLGGSGPTVTTTNPRGAGAITGARAGGGPISRGSTYMVGEKGPELITAGRSGYVNKAGAGGGNVPNVTIGPFHFTNTSAADATEITNQMRRVLREEVRETFRGVFADTGMRMA